MRINKKNLGVLVLVMVMAFAPVAFAAGEAGNIEKIQDNELVLTTLNDQGDAAGVKVLSHLRFFGEGSISLEDGSNYELKSIKNLYGKEKIEQKDGKLAINVDMAKGEAYKDVYYLAELDQEQVASIEMPVNISLEYYLDEQKLSPSDLAGKSGHLKIICKMENLTAAKKTLEYVNSEGEKVKSEAEIYTPYIVSLKDWEFDNRYFSNVNAPGIAGESPQGVPVDLQGKTTVSWTVPLIPPAYPAKQYIVLEADGTNIELPSFNIAVVPIIPTTSSVDSLGSVQESLAKLYDAFDAIQTGVGSNDANNTLIWGLGSIQSGMGQMSGGIASLIDKMKQIRYGLENPAFDLKSYDSAKGTDAQGDKPSVKNAVDICKDGVDNKLLPAFAAQKMVLGVMEQVMGEPGDTPVQPTAATSVYNDVNYLKGLVAGTPAESLIDQAINPKLAAMKANVAVFRDGGEMITSTGTVPFPASISAVETGAKQMSEGLAKASGGLGMIVLGMGSVDANGQPVKVLINGKPGSILYALSYFDSAINAQVLPGVNKLQDGASKISDGSGQAKEGIAAGLDMMASAPAIVSALQENADKADTFLGKPESAEGTVTYVFQTPAVSLAGNVMNYGLIAIVLALIVLFAVGRSPKQVAQISKEESSKEM